MITTKEASRLATTHFTILNCVLCGKSYVYCQCVCTYCGEKIWQQTLHGWHHHVCGGKRSGSTTR